MLAKRVICLRYTLVKGRCLIKNCDGFTLVEVLFAFTFFIFICATILPIVTHLYKERVTLNEKRNVLYTLEEEVQSYAVGLRMTSSENVVYTSVNENVTKLCLKWLGTNGREYEHCLLAPK